MFSVILGESISSILEIVSRLPGGIMTRITFPKDKVLSLAVVASLVKDFLDFVLEVLRARDLDRWWRSLSSRNEFLRRRLMSLEQGDVEYWVDAHVLGQLQLVSRWRDDRFNRIGSYELGLQLLQRTVLFSIGLDMHG